MQRDGSIKQTRDKRRVQSGYHLNLLRVLFT